MKNLYNEIENNLKKGLCVVVKSDNSYCSILNHKDQDGYYRNSDWWYSIEESKQWIGYCCGDSKETWDDLDLEIVEIFRPEFEPFKIGQKVRLLDSIKKTEDWDDVGDSFIDMTGRIKAVYYKGIYYSINGWNIRHEYLAPLPPTKKEVEELTLSEVCKLLGKDIKIKK